MRWDFSNSLALFSVFSIGSISSKRLTERGHKTDLSPWITPTQRFWLLNGGCSREIGEAIFQPNTNERCATTNLLPLNAAFRTWFTSFVIEKCITCNCYLYFSSIQRCALFLQRIVFSISIKQTTRLSSVNDAKHFRIRLKALISFQMLAILLHLKVCITIIVFVFHGVRVHNSFPL